MKKLSLSSKLAGGSKGLSCGSNSNQSSLIAVVDDNLLVWSCQDCCFYAQHMLQNDAPIQVQSKVLNGHL